MRLAPAGIRDAVAIGGSAQHPAADDFTMMKAPHAFELRLDDRELDPQSARELEAGAVGGFVQLLDQQLRDEIAAQAGLFE